jgi:hypothetical protein
LPNRLPPPILLLHGRAWSSVLRMLNFGNTTMRNTSEILQRKLYKPKRAAAILDCSLRYVYYLEERGDLEFVRDGRSAFVVADSLDAYVARLRAEAAAARAKDKHEHAPA